MSIERAPSDPSPPPPVRRVRASTTERGDATRTRILAAAERLYAERGFSGVSMPVLAKAAGITAGAIYKHFDSKEALFFEVVRRAVMAEPASGLAGEGGAAASIAEVVASYTTRRMKLVRQMAVEVHYASARDAKVRRLLRHAVDREIGEIGAGLAAAQASGDLAAGADPHLLASAIMTFIMGLMHMETLTPQLVGDAGWRNFVRERVIAMVTGG
ncbi:MAG TPA: helix-turn-helix domain-containing protein [Caulobacteraceae bacterium]|nr:helix-turn-helix domain-containing protein [Caulobacteraceae bacterium]